MALPLAGRLARFAYTYVHLPIVAGIVVAAVGDKFLLAHPGDEADWPAALSLLEPASVPTVRTVGTGGLGEERRGHLTDRQRRDQRTVRTDEGALADLGFIFEIAVIIAGDRACAEVRVGTHGDVAEIGQVADLHAGVEHAVLDLDEVADMGAGTDVGAGPQPGML